MPIRVHLDIMLARRKMRAKQLAEQIGLSETQLSLLRTEKVRGIRFDTLSKICLVLNCKPADILDYEINAGDMEPGDTV